MDRVKARRLHKPSAELGYYWPRGTVTCLPRYMINGRRLTLNYHMYSSLLEIDIRPGLGFGIFELGVFNVHI